MNLSSSDNYLNFHEPEKIIDQKQDDLESLNNIDDMFQPKPFLFNDHPIFPNEEKNLDTFPKRLLSDYDLSLTNQFSPYSKLSESDLLSESDYLGQNFMKASNEFSGASLFDQLSPFNESNEAKVNNIKQRIFKDENPITCRKGSDICENSNTNQNSFSLLRKINDKSKNLKFFVFDSTHLNTNDGNRSYINLSRFKTVSKKKQRYFETDFSSIKNTLEEDRKFLYKCEHPGCSQTFRTKKLKLNRHDLSDPECKIDIITLLNLVKKTGDILKLKGKKTKSFRIRKLKKMYKKSIIGLPHYEYAINILGRKC